MTNQVEIQDTYAEAFRSIYAEVLITTRDRFWLDHAVNACTGHASSTIMCDCEAGLDHYVDPADTILTLSITLTTCHMTGFLLNHTNGAPVVTIQETI